MTFYETIKIEIDKKWKESIKKTEALKKTHPSILEKKVGRIKDIY